MGAAVMALRAVAVGSIILSSLYGSPVLAAPNSDQNRISGFIDGVVEEGTSVYALGWVCEEGLPTQPEVHVYIGGPAGAGELAGVGRANLPSEPAIAEKCGLSGTQQRFLRYKVALRPEAIAFRAGKRVYVHGISSAAKPNDLLTNSGRYPLPRGPAPGSFDDKVHPVIGAVDGVIEDKASQKFYLAGFACARDINQSIDVHVYMGTTADRGGQAVGVAKANLRSEPGVTGLCLPAANQGNPRPPESAFRFLIEMPDALRFKYSEHGIFVYGISPVAGAAPRLLDHSGKRFMPKYRQTSVASRVQGAVDGVISENGKHFLVGFACSKFHAGSIDVHAYVGGPAGKGMGLAAGTANMPSEPAVSSFCGLAADALRFRYKIEISENALLAHRGKAIFVHGISPFGKANSLLTHSGRRTMPTTLPAHLISKVAGAVDGVVKDAVTGKSYVAGFACSKSHNASIEVHVYVGGSAGKGIMVASAMANRASEPQVAQFCGVTPGQTGFRYLVEIPVNILQSHAGRGIYVHGISPFGRSNNLLTHSGRRRLPPAL